MRCYSSDALTETMAPYLPIDGFNPEDWLADHKNIALEISGDFALFEYVNKGVYTGHYFFKSRGKRAVERGRDLLHEAFMGGHGIKAIRGLSPLEKLGARWLNRQRRLWTNERLVCIKLYGLLSGMSGETRIHNWLPFI